MDWSNPLIYVGAATFLYAIVRGLLRIGEWKGKTDGSVKTLKEAIDEIRQDIKRILGHVGPAAVAGQSPLRLTELGIGISEDIDAKEWAKEKAQHIAAQVAGKPPYDIQQFCFDLVRGQKHVPATDLLMKMKAAAYNHGTTIEQVENVLAIELRDVLLGIRGLEPPDNGSTP